MAAPKGNGLDAANAAKTHTSNTLGFTPKITRFSGTENQRQFRVIAALMRRPVNRQEIDPIAGCANGPYLVASIRALGLTEANMPCDRINFVDRDGKPCRPGIYSHAEKCKRMVNAWMKSRAAKSEQASCE
jgi:hypothetical protein